VNKNGQHDEETNSANGNQHDIELENNNTYKDNDSAITDDDDDDMYGDYSAKVEDKNSSTNEISSDDGEKENENNYNYNNNKLSMPENVVHDITTTSFTSTPNNNATENKKELFASTTFTHSRYSTYKWKYSHQQ
jgi:hypothetical protein